MLLSKKVIALASGTLIAISFAALAQDPPAGKGQTIVVAGAIDWVEKSDVSALKEGVIKQIEFQVGRVVKEGQPIGYLHDEIAQLSKAKAKLIAESTGDISKAKAQVQLATAQVARNMRLDKRGSGFLSIDEKEKAEADLAVATALLQSANEAQKVNQADYALAERSLAEHVILAPFTGVITDRMKNPGESVRSNEPVVRLGRIDKLRFVGWVPLEVALRLKGNEAVEVRPVIEGSDLAIEQAKYTGKVTAISREVHANVRTTEVQVLAEIDSPENPDHPELELRPGTKGEMTIFLGNLAVKVDPNKAQR